MNTDKISQAVAEAIIDKLDAERRRQRDEYWAGFDLCCEGKPLAACQNEDQRRGWRGAIKASGYDGMSADQLERMGV